MTGSRGRITVVGLGPGDPGLVTAATLEAIRRVPVRRLRTARHPSAHLVPDARSFDHHYETADTFAEVYEAIARDLIGAADEHGEVLYAVPGSPAVLERTVQLLTEAERRGEVEVDVLPAMSFVDLAWVRLDIDPYDGGASLLDGHVVDEMIRGRRGPALIAHCHNRRVLSDVKLAYGHEPPARAVILHHLGLPDEIVREVDWADLDRDLEPDHLTAVWVPAPARPVGGEVDALVDLVTTLRAECPWDARQTHATLSTHVIEETFEVVDALDAVGDGGPDADPDAYADLEEELGDLLFQIVFHAVLATEAAAFDLDDVARGVHDKLRHRHPHVFPREGVLGDATVDDAEDVAVNWERIKKAEKGRESVFDGIPSGLPALARAAKVLKKTAALDLDVDPFVSSGAPDEATRSGGDTAAEAAGAEVHEGDVEAGIGRRLLEIVAMAREADVDPEAALRRTITEFVDRMRELENPPR